MYKSILSSCFAAKKLVPDILVTFHAPSPSSLFSDKNFLGRFSQETRKDREPEKNEGHRDARMNKPSHFSEIARVYIIATG